MSTIGDFVGHHILLGLLFLFVMLASCIVNSKTEVPLWKTIGSSLVPSTAVAIILLGMWNIASSPLILSKFFRSDFIQAISAVATAGATVALWVVTSRLTQVTKVQVHSVTAPLMVSQIYTRADPAESPEIEKTLFLPAYEFTNEDLSVPEINAFHSERDGAVAGSPRASAPRIYIVLRVYNVQAASAYGIASEIEIDTVLSFPRYGIARGASVTTVATPSDLYEQQRTLRVTFLGGQGTFALAAFRVDQVPFWVFRINEIRHKDARGKLGTYAVGAKSASFGQAGLTIESGTFPPMKDEQPR